MSRKSTHPGHNSSGEIQNSQNISFATLYTLSEAIKV